MVHAGLLTTAIVSLAFAISASAQQTTGTPGSPSATAAAPSRPHAADPIFKVILLGTGAIEYTVDRTGYSTMVEVNQQKLLFDLGGSPAQRLYESGVNPKDVTTIFLTHLHNDHIEGLPNLWLVPWVILSRTASLELWGPAGTAGMVEGMRKMYQHDLDHRANSVLKREYLDISVHEIKEGVVYERNGVKVTGFAVEHGDGNPAFGYRIDYRGHSVVLSGDTTLDENVIKQGKNADLLVHNVVGYAAALESLPMYKVVAIKLTTPEQAAEIFNKTKPKLAVYSHISKLGLSGKKGDQVIVERTRKAGYTGPLQMGVDRMVIEVGDSVRVLAPKSVANLLDLLDQKKK